LVHRIWGGRTKIIPAAAAPALGCGTPGSPFGTEADLANYVTSNPTTHTAVQYNGRLDAISPNNDRIGFAIYWVPQSTDNFNGVVPTTSSITPKSMTRFPSSEFTPSRDAA